MIALIRFPLHGSAGEAVLADDGTWSCADPMIEATLNTLILGASRSPSLGKLHWRHAREMAEMLGGTVEYEDKDEGPPGRIY